MSTAERTTMDSAAAATSAAVQSSLPLAIPAVAVPLLQDDGIDTMVDDDWVWDSIHLEAADTSRRLDLGGLQRTVKTWFEPAVLDDLLGPAEGHAERVAREWLGVGGKRWRPFLAAAVHAALVPG